MNPDRPNDDPTHALDDFVRRMRPATSAAPAPAPDLSGLQARLHPDRAPGPTRLRGGTLRSGQTWQADDVVDVPMVTLPPVSAPAAVDRRTLDQTLQQASDQVSALWSAETLAASAAAWQPSPQTLQLRRAAHPRLPTAWQPGAWTAAVREVLAPSTEFVTTPGGTAVESYPPQRLLLLWPPQRLDAPLLGRWPQQAMLSAVPADQAAEALLALLPEPALLWLNPTTDAVDWALAAEIVLHHQTTLRPFQAAGLRRFIETEREATFKRLNAEYQTPVAGAAVQQR